MGDFDKPQAGSTTNAAANERKLAMVGLLGAVLLAVVGYHFMKGGPQPALASDPAVEGTAVGVAPETPAQALAALDSSKDPTAKLLIGSAALPVEYTELPRDPFRISDTWRAQLTKPVDVTRPVATHVDSVAPAAAPMPSAPKVNVDGLKLTGIFEQGKTLYATINGNLVTVGGTIGEARVVEIESNAVKLRHVDWPGGPVTTLTIQGKK